MLRSRTALDDRLRPLVTGDWHRTSADLKDVLRIGAFQLTRLTRVPAYAAVDATVELAGQVRNRKAAGFVNAVLRKVAAETATGDDGAEAAGRSMAARFSHPEWLVRRWVERYGPDRTEALLAHNNTRPRVVIQPARSTPEELAALLDEAGVVHRPATGGPGLAVEAGRVQELPGYADGAFVVQDPVQARLIAYADVPEGCLVWDACAAPGGKTVLLARRGPVLASDRARDRIGVLRATVRRAGPPPGPVRLVLADARTPPLRPESVRAVMVDAPCSATGTMARHPDARWQLSAERIAGHVRLQAELLDGAAGTVGPGGLLVYITCSLEPEENERQVDAFLARRPDFSREGEDCTIFPPDAGTDGGYAARLRRRP